MQSQIRSSFKKLTLFPRSIKSANPKEKLMSLIHLALISATLMPLVQAVSVALQ